MIWRNFYQAIGRKIFVVCDYRSYVRNTHSKINYCLGNHAHPPKWADCVSKIGKLASRSGDYFARPSGAKMLLDVNLSCEMWVQ